MSLTLSFPRSPPLPEQPVVFPQEGATTSTSTCSTEKITSRKIYRWCNKRPCMPLLSNSRCLPFLFSRSYRDSFLCHFSLLACTLIRSMPLYSLAQRSRSTSMRDFYDSSVPRRDQSHRPIEGWSIHYHRSENAKNPTSQPPGHDKIMT